MRMVLGVLVFMIGLVISAQSIEYNTKKGYVANGYDVVAYFSDKPLEGKGEFTATHDKVKFKFANEENLKAFLANPPKYIPQYGGYCAYALAVSGKKVSVNPETYEIRDGKLYLFYNSGKNNTLEFWKNESPDALRQKADENWEKIKKK